MTDTPRSAAPTATVTDFGADLPGAYAACEEITRREARNFSYGIRLLPAPKRTALSAVYALARRIDDIGDGDLPEAQTFEAKLVALAAVRASVQSMREGTPDPTDPVLVGVHDAVHRYPIPLGAFDELVDGVEADTRMDEQARRTGEPARPHETFSDMEVYCRQVAGSVGRLCLGIFGSRPAERRPAQSTVDTERAATYADQLGIALQQTNILRDLREDLQNGRVYLPTDELARFGAELRLDAAGALVDPTGGLAAYIRFAADRARRWYADGLKLLPLLDRRSAACAGAMAGIYRRLLEDIAAEPESVFAQRRSLSGGQKLVVAVKALAGRTS